MSLDFSRRISGRPCFQHFDESMPLRIKAVVKAKGGPTFYQQGIPVSVPNIIDFELCKICVVLKRTLWNLFFKFTNLGSWVKVLWRPIKQGAEKHLFTDPPNSHEGSKYQLMALPPASH